MRAEWTERSVLFALFGLIVFLVFFVPAWKAEWEHKHEEHQAAVQFYAANCENYELQVQRDATAECHRRKHVINRNSAWSAVGTVFARWFGATFGDGILGMILFCIFVAVLIILYNGYTVAENNLQHRTRDLIPRHLHAEHGRSSFGLFRPDSKKAE